MFLEGNLILYNPLKLRLHERNVLGIINYNSKTQSRFTVKSNSALRFIFSSLFSSGDSDIGDTKNHNPIQTKGAMTKKFAIAPFAF